MAQGHTADQLKALVREDEIHRSVYTDPALFDLEMERVFEATWVFVGHDSQVKNPGDFITATIGRQGVIMTRSQDGTVNVMYNRCAHKGAQLTSARDGNAKTFRCGYHGWVFDVDGTNKHIPAEAGYEGTAIAQGNCKLNVRHVAKVETYRGFVFASLSADVPPLKEYLGESTSSIDNMVDRAPEGELECVPGVLRYRHDSNWKFWMENLNDLLHAVVAHNSSSYTARKVAKQELAEGEVVPALEILAPFTANYSFFDEMGVMVYPHGHSFSGTGKSIHAAYSDIPAYQDAMEAAYGKDRTAEIFATNRHNTCYYPSLTIKGAIQAFRVVRPISVDETIVETYHLRLKGAPEELLERTVLYSNLINSSAMLVGPDDAEQYRRMQKGLQTQANDWVSVHRYLGREQEDVDGGTKAIGSSDIVFRNQFKAWLALMLKGAPSDVEAAA